MVYREEIAIDKGPDHTVKFFMEGYKYISNRTKHYNRNMFQTRLLGGKIFICMIGEDAINLFYDQSKIKRQGANPPRILKSFLGEGGVQTLDGARHKHRKDLFMSLMTKERLNDIKAIFKSEWRDAFSEKQQSLVLYEKAKIILMKTALAWAGIPGNQIKKGDITNQLASLFENAWIVGLRG